MVTMAELEHMTYDGHLMKWADGGYPVVYGMADGSNFCAACATEAINLTDDDGVPTGVQDFRLIREINQHLEGSPIDCDGCAISIKSAHGDPDGCATCQDLTTDETAHFYVIPSEETDNDAEILCDARDGDLVCIEHARHCLFCRQCFVPSQFENHILMGECPGLKIGRAAALRFLFGLGTEVLVSRRDGQGRAHGVVVGMVDWGGYVSVAVDGDDGEPYEGTYADWAVKRADIHAV